MKYRTPVEQLKAKQDYLHKLISDTSSIMYEAKHKYDRYCNLWINDKYKEIALKMRYETMQDVYNTLQEYWQVLQDEIITLRQSELSQNKPKADEKNQSIGGSGLTGDIPA